MNDQTQELQWISAARRGDADAFESLVHLYEKRVFSLALRMCGNQEDAAEAAQEAFLLPGRVQFFHLAVPPDQQRVCGPAAPGEPPPGCGRPIDGR